jgi:hypothetical protein
MECKMPRGFGKSKGLFTEEPEQEREDHTNQDACHDRKIKREVPARVMNVTRQPPKPVFPEARPHDYADGSDEQPEQHKELAKFIHVKRSLCRGNTYFKRGAGVMNHQISGCSTNECLSSTLPN